MVIPLKPMNQTPTFYRRKLPHLQPPGGTFFATFRLAGSLPKEVVVRLREEQAQMGRVLLRIKDEKQRRQLIRNQRKRYFGKFDALLDGAQSGPVWLKDDRIAGLVADAIHYRDSKDFDLHSYTIMPNHVHLVVGLDGIVRRRGSSSCALTQRLENLKWYTALKSNEILHRTGAFWQHESYDHLVRDAEELERTIQYILNNPVKAGLVKDWRDWKWNYRKPKS